MNANNNIAVFILAGGKSSRMGQDKGLMLLNGKAMIQHIIDLLLPYEMPITILTAERAYSQFKLPTLVDIMPNKGPLGGIYTAAVNSPTPYFLVISCDTPFLTAAVIDRLLQHPTQTDALVVSAQQQLHPLVAKYHKRVASSLQSQLQQTNVGVKHWLSSLTTTVLDMTSLQNESPRTFDNLNQPADIYPPLQILVFGSLTEVLGNTTISFPYYADTHALQAALLAAYPALGPEPRFFIAINRVMVQQVQPIPLQAEIALMPPFSGG